MRILPISLTSLVLEGHETDENEDHYQRLMLQDWVFNVQPGNRLRELRIFNYSDCNGTLLAELDLSELLELTELSVLLTPNEPFTSSFFMNMTASLNLLSKLQVLEVGTCNWGWGSSTMQVCFGVDDGGVGLFSGLRELKRVGWVDLHSVAQAQNARLSQMEELCCHFRKRHLPDWMTARCLPRLQSLKLEGGHFYDDTVQSIAKLTQLTSLRMDTAMAHLSSVTVTWGSMDLLGRGLPGLQRLEVVNYAVAPQGGDVLGGQPLAMPDLSAFTQMKQLQLVCVLNPEDGMPVQPSSKDFLGGLSVLTQLEQLQLEGYSSE